jgi:hypothetical protein
MVWRSVNRVLTDRETDVNRACESETQDLEQELGLGPKLVGAERIGKRRG